MLGWPIIDNIGGWSIDSWIEKIETNRKNSEYRIGENDSHPNLEGHKRIANKLYKEIKNGDLFTIGK